jgi:arginyl-tRNA synthetase
MKEPLKRLLGRDKEIANDVAKELSEHYSIVKKEFADGYFLAKMGRSYLHDEAEELYNKLKAYGVNII